MRYFGLAALVVALLALAASGQVADDARPADRYYAIVNETTSPSATETGEDGQPCASTLETKCPSQSEWTTIGSFPVDLQCNTTDGEVSYREPVLPTEEDVDWACSITASSAPAGAFKSTQVVTVRGGLTACEVSAITAQVSCDYTCRDAAGGPTHCDDQ